MKKQLVRLNKRTWGKGKDKRTTYTLRYVDEFGKRTQKTLGTCNKKKAEYERKALEKELKGASLGFDSLRLSDFAEDSLRRTGNQIRESTQADYREVMTSFVETIGDIDYQKVEHKHAEIFVRECLDADLAPATVAKKVRVVKRFFQLAVDRGQLDENPLKRVKQPKSSKRKNRIYTDNECRRIINAATENSSWFRMDLMMILALTTGMRKGELLNAVWSNVDFGAKTIDVQPKENTETTWHWQVKDSDCRTLPLTDEMISVLADLQAKAPEGYPYILVPPSRYDRIQELRQNGLWKYADARNKVIHNFTRLFQQVLCKAGVKKGTFHDLRRTALRNWLSNGVSEYDVMALAGHSKFETTHKFYLSVSNDLMDRARKASSNMSRLNFGARMVQAQKNEFEAKNKPL